MSKHHQGTTTIIVDEKKIFQNTETVFPYLVILAPKQYHLITEMPKTIGRSDQANIILDDTQISRLHCQIYISQQGIIIHDLNSTNGTYLNTQPIKKTILTADARLQLGSYECKLEYKTYTEVKRDRELLATVNLDALTGIANRQWFDNTYQQEKNRRQHYSNSSLLVLDIDHFKHVNDNYGHLAGDAILQQFANILAEEKRSSDLLARYGGEEFIMFLPNTIPLSAKILAERIRYRIECTEFIYKDTIIPLTTSIGISTQEQTFHSLNTLFEKADKALYQAKASGRNRVIINTYN